MCHVTHLLPTSCFVIVEISDGAQRHDIGIIVDTVSEVREIPRSKIEPAPTLGAKPRADFIQGMGRIANKFVVLPDIAKVQSVEEMSSLISSGNTIEDECNAGA